MSFSKWFKLQEMGSHVAADISNVKLVNRYGNYYYYFNVAGNDYKVEFAGPYEWEGYTAGKSVIIANKSFTVGFSKDGSYDLTGDTNVPTAVYGEVFKAVRKLIEAEQPDALKFHGADNKQDVMYDLFYRKYLIKLFTRVGWERYLRNDLYNKYKQENGMQWMAMEDYERENSSYGPDRLSRGVNRRNQDREYRRVQNNSPLKAPPAPPRQRGDRLPNGNIYIGVSPFGVEWDASPQEYVRRAAEFDQLHAAVRQP